MDVIGQSNVNLLAGNVDKGQYEFAVRSMGAFESVEEIGDIGVHATRQGSIIPLKELATVKDAYMEANDYARLNLEQNVTVYVKKTALSNTIPVVKSAQLVIREFEEAHDEQIDIVVVSDKAETINNAIGEVKTSLLIGLALTVIIIYVFLRNLVLAMIILIAIPCSVIGAFLAMASAGVSINIMSMSGLALAIGIMVDSAVVIIENIFVKKEKGYSDMRAIREGSEEVFMPLVASMVTSLIVFVPILLIDKKIQMQYFGFAYTVSAALIFSLFVALMLIPVLMAQFARGKMPSGSTGSTSKWQEKMRSAYGFLVRQTLKFRYIVVVVLSVVFVYTTIGILNKDIDFPTALEENEFAVVIFPLAGARLEANDDAVKKVEDMLSKIPDVSMSSSTVRKDDVRIFVRLKPTKERQYSKEEIMQLLDEKGNEAIKEIHDDYSLILDEGASSSEGKKLVVNIFGHENEVLEKLAREFAQRMGKIPGLTNIVMTDLRKRPEYSLVVDKGRAAIYGLDVQKVADSIHAQVRGMRPTKFREISKGEEIETITRLQAIYRQKIEDLKYIPIQTKYGTQIPLGEIGNFYPSTGPQTIDRKDKYRYVFVKGDAKIALETLAKEVEKTLREVPLPDDYYFRFGGNYEDLIAGKAQMQTALLLTVFLVYMVLACMFQSYLQPVLVMMSVPMASIGIYLALEIGHKPLSQPVFIGMILLAGYVVNASIILIDHLNGLLREGVEFTDALIRAGIDRLRPILMTTCSTVCGFIPMTLDTGQSSDLWSPLATTVIGGLLSSTILTLFVLPVFLYIAEEVKRKIKELKLYFSRVRPGGEPVAGAPPA